MSPNLLGNRSALAGLAPGRFGGLATVASTTVEQPNLFIELDLRLLPEIVAMSLKLGFQCQVQHRKVLNEPA